MSRKIVIHKRSGTVAARPIAMAAPRVVSPAQATAPSATGTIVGGWVVLLVGSIVCFLPLMQIPGAALLLAAGVLAIAGMVRGSICGGIILLLSCFIVPALLVVGFFGGLIAAFS